MLGDGYLSRGEMPGHGIDIRSKRGFRELGITCPKELSLGLSLGVKNKGTYQVGVRCLVHIAASGVYAISIAGGGWGLLSDLRTNVAVRVGFPLERLLDGSGLGVCHLYQGVPPFCP